MAQQNTARREDEEPSHANRPADEVRVGNVKIAIWRNAGDKGDFYSAGAPQLSYKDEQGNWKEGKNYGAMDLLALSKASDMAAERIIELSKSRGQSR